MPGNTRINTASKLNKLSPLTQNLCPAHPLRCFALGLHGSGWQEVAVESGAQGLHLFAGPTGAQIQCLINFV